MVLTHGERRVSMDGLPDGAGASACVQLTPNVKGGRHGSVVGYY